MIWDRRATGIVLAWCTAAASGWPQPSMAAVVSSADYARAERLLPYRVTPLVQHQVEAPSWLSDGSLWYRTSGAAGTEFVHVDPRRHTRTPLFDHAALARALSQAAGQPVDAARLPWSGVALTGTPPALDFDAFSRHWSCALPAGPCASTLAADATASVSPDGKRAVFIRDGNLWRRDLASGEEHALTADALPDFGYATDNPGWEHSAHAVVAWSADSRQIATYQQDERGVGEMYLATTQPGHPQLERWKYAMAGDPVIATLQRVVIDVATGRTVRLQMPPDPHRSSACYDVQCGDGTLADVQWSADGRQLAFVSTSRTHQLAQLRIADPATGRVRQLLEERVPTFYESDIASTSHGAVNWRFLPALNRVIWYSERSGRAHLYLYDLANGRLLQPITQGDWDVVEILRVDERARQIYFTAVGHEPGRDPYYMHFYRIDLDGRHLTLLTPEDANHDISVAPAGGYFVDRYSTPQTPPVAVLRDATGRRLMTLERADIAPLLAAGWHPAESITVKARDGRTDLYGLLFKPAGFDATRKYPVIVWVYPGPQMGSVGTRSFLPARGDRQALAELGFIVVTLDGLGTPFRGKRFHDAYFGHMRDNTLPDQVAALQQLARRYPYVDLQRVGIYGHSGGGYATAAAMFTYPELFQVGVAESGNHDQHDYTDDWGDKFGATNDPAQDNFSIAQNLKGHLLLAHGTMDDNVPPYLTLRLVDALIKANKDFDLLLLPNERHPYRGAAGLYMARRRWDYFVRHLLRAEPPHEFAFSQQPGPTDEQE